MSELNSSYTQVKVSVKRETAMAFKRACASADTSMTAVISGFMNRYSGSAAQKGCYAPDLSSRRQRRAAVKAITAQLERVRDNEERYLYSIPENLRGGHFFEEAEQCLMVLEEILDLLSSVY